jgi:DNA-binding phage protein
MLRRCRDSVFILAARGTRYRITTEAGVDSTQLSRFVDGRGGMSLATLDKVCEVLRLRLAQDADE